MTRYSARRFGVTALGIAFLALLTPWIARIVWAGGSLAVGGPATHTGIVCQVALEGEPTVCVASFGAVMLVAMLLILAAGSLLLVGAWRFRPRVLEIAAFLAPVAWLLVVFDRASRGGQFFGDYQFSPSGLGVALAQPWTLIQGIILLAGAVAAWQIARRERSLPVTKSAA